MLQIKKESGKWGTGNRRQGTGNRRQGTGKAEWKQVLCKNG
jgi:hypothetical protein